MDANPTILGFLGRHFHPVVLFSVRNYFQHEIIVQHLAFISFVSRGSFA